MKEHPIIFSGEEVRAVLEERKTMMRRVIKPQPMKGHWIDQLGVNEGYRFAELFSDAKIHSFIDCPYGQPGDRLWVRETWGPSVDVNQVGFPTDRPFLKFEDVCPAGLDLKWSCDYIIFRADGETEWCDEDGGMTDASYWRPSIHMPRWASRITLEVVKVRVERVKQINAGDVFKEGLNPMSGCGVTDTMLTFKPTWDSLNSKRGYGWEQNPWCWVIEFKKVEPSKP